MNLEEKTKEYQAMLVKEYRNTHPEETENLTDEEVALMNPITSMEFEMLISNELRAINTEITDLMADIKDTENEINDPKLNYQAKTEYRSDVVNDKRKIAELRKKYDNLKRILSERENKDERSR